MGRWSGRVNSVERGFPLPPRASETRLAWGLTREKPPRRRGFSRSGWPDLNRRPLDPQSSALTKLRHSPRWSPPMTGAVSSEAPGGANGQLTAGESVPPPGSGPGLAGDGLR